MKQPDQDTPGLEISMPVINIGEKEISGLKERLADKTGEPVDSRHMRKLFKPARSLRSMLASRHEIRLIQKYAGFPSIDEEHAEELKGYMDSVASETGLARRMIEAPTLPAEPEHINGGLALSIAGCLETVQARILVKGALCNFYGLKRVPAARIWSDDSITRPVLAMSYGSALNGLLLRLHKELTCDDELLPETTKIGGFNPELTGPENRAE